MTFYKKFTDSKNYWRKSSNISFISKKNELKNGLENTKAKVLLGYLWINKQIVRNLRRDHTFFHHLVINKIKEKV